MAKAKNKSVAGNGKAKKTAENIDSSISLSVMKTYKMYIGGKFPRTESGRFYKLKNADNQLIANICQGSRKDFRNSVVAARKAFPGWAKKTAYNRGQILYRMAEMLEGRKAQFEEELVSLGYASKKAAAEIRASIDRLVYYAGWTDKYQQVFSSVNPVASSHFNFSVLEPMGVVAAFSPENQGLLGLVSIIAPVIAGGNTLVILASNSNPISAVSFAEVLQTSDLPGGVVNILTGFRDELSEHFSTHMDVNAMIYCGTDEKEIAAIQVHAAHNLKRVFHYELEDWADESGQGPYFITDFQETKTTWHPIGK